MSSGFQKESSKWTLAWLNIETCKTCVKQWGSHALADTLKEQAAKSKNEQKSKHT